MCCGCGGGDGSALSYYSYYYHQQPALEVLRIEEDTINWRANTVVGSIGAPVHIAAASSAGEARIRLRGGGLEGTGPRSSQSHSLAAWIYNENEK